MSIERKRVQKEKSRQKEVKIKLLKRREFKRSLVKEEREEQRAQIKFKKEQKEMAKLEEKMEELYSKLPPDTRAQLEKNIEILKALEEQHDREISHKQELNQELETEGILPLEEKLKALHEKAAKDVSVVEVIKAEVVEAEVLDDSGESDSKS